MVQKTTNEMEAVERFNSAVDAVDYAERQAIKHERRKNHLENA
jgi:hypothetical protein